VVGKNGAAILQMDGVSPRRGAGEHHNESEQISDTEPH
jgi:hypothetical protein